MNNFIDSVMIINCRNWCKNYEMYGSEACDWCIKNVG